MEIRIEEGYERGGYDHRHYQTHTTTWSEYEDEGRSHSEDKEEGGKIPSNDYSSEEEEGVSQGGFSTNTALYDSSVASFKYISQTFKLTGWQLKYISGKFKSSTAKFKGAQIESFRYGFKYCETES